MKFEFILKGKYPSGIGTEYKLTKANVLDRLADIIYSRRNWWKSNNEVRPDWDEYQLMYQVDGITVYQAPNCMDILSWISSGYFPAHGDKDIYRELLEEAQPLSIS